MEARTRLILRLTIPLVLALVSFFYLGRLFSAPETYPDTLAYLDEKKLTVSELAGAATAASVAITAIPGDTATPIADKLADLSSYFLLIVCAIFLEKYLVTITGFAAFKVLIPLACLLLAADCFVRTDGCRRVAMRIGAFALAVFLLVPVSVKAGQLIEKTYQESIAESLDVPAVEVTADTAQGAATEEGNWLEQLLRRANETINQVKESVTAVPEQLEKTLSRFIEAVAVLIVTSCLIPILVLVALIWLMRMLLGLEERSAPKKRDVFPLPFGHRKPKDE